MTQLLAKANITPTPDVDTARTALGNMWDVISEMLQMPEVDITCAATLDVGGQSSARLRLVGTPVNITSFGSNYRGPVFIRASNSYTIVHNSTTLICRAGWWPSLNAGDVIIAVPKSSLSGTADGWEVLEVFRMDGSGMFNSLNLRGEFPLWFDGATAGGFATRVRIMDPTATRTLTIPNADVDLTNVRDATTALKGVTRFADSSEVLPYLSGGYSSSIAVTPASLTSARAYSTFGYQRLPGGLVVQWGQSGPWAKDTWGPVGFSLAFTGGVFAISTTNMQAGTTDNDVGFRVIDYTSTQFNVRCEAYSATSFNSNYLHYIALGWAY